MTAKAKGSTPLHPENLKQAAEVLSEVGDRIYALDDVGRRFEGVKFSPISCSVIVRALTASIREDLEEAESLFSSERDHPALSEIYSALDCLTALDEVIISVTGDDEFTLRESTIGITILDFTVRLGKCVERAEIACGRPCGSTDYLEHGGEHDPRVMTSSLYGAASG